MKSKLLKLINNAISIFKVNLIKKSDNVFDIDSALNRLKQHGFRFASVIDIGAASGIWSKNVMHHFPSLNNVLAIEPLEERKVFLASLASSNSKFKFASCIAGEIDYETKTLHVSDDLDGTTVNGSGGLVRQVLVRSIDGLVSEHMIAGPFLIKFDTHGYEVPILKGASATLSNTEIIIMEVYNYSVSENSIRFHEMCTYLETLGFRCFDIVNPMLRPYDNTLWQADFFFCKKDHKMFLHNDYQ